MTEEKPEPQRPSLDFATLAGLGVALSALVGGLILEGGSLQDVSQFTAAIIVGGGTCGAVLVSTPLLVLKGALRRLLGLFQEQSNAAGNLIEDLVDYATRARKHGIISLEQEALDAKSPFLRKGLILAVDGTDIQELRSMMEIEMSMHEQRGEAEAKVFECAGGYAPTVGIIGAVLGLIQVMKHLDDIKEVGHGIAVSFVATVYGVAIANLILLPAAAKIRSRLQHEVELQELMLEGIVAIIEGMNPKLIRSKLEAYQHPHIVKPAGKRAGPRRAAAA